MAIRRADECDLPAIVGLKLRMFQEAGLVSLLAARFTDIVSADYRVLYGRGEAAHFVCVNGDAIVAMAGGFIKSDLPHRYYANPRYGWLGDVYTAPEGRRQGLARALSVRVLEWLHTQGVDTVRLFATEAGRPLYESLRFRATDEMALHFSREQ